MRTINATSDFLYCEYITNFIAFYDMTTDPFQVTVNDVLLALSALALALLNAIAHLCLSIAWGKTVKLISSTIVGPHLHSPPLKAFLLELIIADFYSSVNRFRLLMIQDLIVSVDCQWLCLME